MADTHPNAFRAEASAKRTQATLLSAEADGLDAQADALENPSKVAPIATEADLPAGGENYDPKAEKASDDKTDDKEEKTSKIPFKKS